MRARGIDTAGVERAAGRTFRWAGRYDADLATRTTLDTQLNVFADFQPKIPAAYRDTPLVLLGNIHPALQIEVLDQVERPRLVVADTMNFWIDGRAGPGRRHAQAHRPPRHQRRGGAAALGPAQHPPRGARHPRSAGPRRLIIKRGEHGALLFDEHGVFAAPGFPLEDVVDPTGAGDSFAGGFIGYLAQQPEIDCPCAAPRDDPRHGDGVVLRRGRGYAKIAAVTRADVAARVAAIRALYDFGAGTM